MPDTDMLQGFMGGLFGGLQSMQQLQMGQYKLNAAQALEDSANAQKAALDAGAQTDQTPDTSYDQTVPYSGGQPQPSSGAGSELSGTTPSAGTAYANPALLAQPTKSIPGAVPTGAQDGWSDDSTQGTAPTPTASANAATAAQPPPAASAATNTQAPASPTAGAVPTSQTPPAQPSASTGVGATNAPDDPTKNLTDAQLTGVAAGLGAGVPGVTPEMARQALANRQQTNYDQNAPSFGMDPGSIVPGPSGSQMQAITNTNPLQNMDEQSLMGIATGVNPAATVSQSAARQELLRRHPELAPAAPSNQGAQPAQGGAPGSTQLGPDGNPQIPRGDLSSWSARAQQNYPASVGDRLQQGALPPNTFTPPTSAPPGPQANAAPAQPSLGARIANAILPSAAAATLPSATQAPTSQGGTPATPPSGAVAGAGSAPAAGTPTGGAPITPSGPAAGAIGQRVPASPNVPPVAAPVQLPSPNVPVPPKSPAAGAPVSVPAQTAPVAPQQTTPTTQSEANPSFVKPPMDPRPYAALAPQYKALVDDVAQKVGIPPIQLAAMWHVESGGRTSIGDNPKSGAIGPFQMLPSTAKTIDPQGQLNIRELRGNMTLAAMYIKQGNDIYGAMSPGAQLYYHNGPAGAKQIIDQINKGVPPQQALAGMPETAQNLSRYFPGTQFAPNHFQPGIQLDPQQLTQSGVSSGPDGFLHFLARSVPAAGVPMGDMWRAAEGTIARAAILNGDPAGAAHAVQLATMMSQQGYVTNIGRAYAALNSGDAAGAANLLARANSFFPDGAMGKFGVDANNNLWMQRVSERDPNVTLGPPVQVTADHLMQQAVVASDPTGYVNALSKMRLNEAQMYEAQAHGNYFNSLPQERAQAQRYAADVRKNAQDNATQERIQTNANTNATRLEVATVNAAQRDAANAEKTAGAQQKGIPDVKSVDAEVTKQFPLPMAGPDGQVDPQAQADNALAADTYSALRLTNPPGAMNPVKAHDLATGVVQGRYGLRPAQGGAYAVVDPKSPNVALGMLPPTVGQRLAQRAQPQQARPQVQPTRSAIPVAPQYSAQPTFALPTAPATQGAIQSAPAPNARGF